MTNPYYKTYLVTDGEVPESVRATSASAAIEQYMRDYSIRWEDDEDDEDRLESVTVTCTAYLFDEEEEEILEEDEREYTFLRNE